MKNRVLWKKTLALTAAAVLTAGAAGCGSEDAGTTADAEASADVAEDAAADSQENATADITEQTEAATVADAPEKDGLIPVRHSPGFE